MTAVTSGAKSQRLPAVGSYLIRIYTTLREGRRVVRARLAERLGVSPSAVTQALRRMGRDGLVELAPEGEIRLTTSGRDQAESIARRHYLIERLLVNVLGYDWAAADEEAEELEHALSPRLEGFLLQKLGRPQTCPHGNPFPGSAHEKELILAPKLSDATAGQQITILRVTEEGEDEEGLLAFFQEHGLGPGTQALVEGKASGAVSLAAGGGTIRVPARWTHYVCVSGIPTP